MHAAASRNAYVASWADRPADVLAELDEKIIYVPPVSSGKELHQLLLRFFRLLRSHPAEAVGDAVDVGVDRYVIFPVVAVDKDYVRGFPSDSVKLQQLFHCVRNTVRVFLVYYPRDFPEPSRFCF